nr:MAG TPA: hypothetical protein [Caudoviricetes sp.]
MTDVWGWVYNDHSQKRKAKRPKRNRRLTP